MEGAPQHAFQVSFLWLTASGALQPMQFDIPDDGQDRLFENFKELCAAHLEQRSGDLLSITAITADGTPFSITCTDDLKRVDETVKLKVEGSLVVDTAHGPGVVIEKKTDGLALVDLFKARDLKRPSKASATTSEDPFTTEILLLPEAIRLRARSYLKQKVMKTFPGQGVFTGKVTKFLPPEREGDPVLWGVVYDDDDDFEELNEQEVQEGIRQASLHERGQQTKRQQGLDAKQVAEKKRRVQMQSLREGAWPRDQMPTALLQHRFSKGREEFLVQWQLIAAAGDLQRRSTWLSVEALVSAGFDDLIKDYYNRVVRRSSGVKSSAANTSPPALQNQIALTDV